MSTPTSRSTDKSLATTFGEHIKELRTRFMVVAAVFLVLSGVTYSFRDILIAIVRKPIGSEQLVYLTPGGGFSFIFSVTMYAAMVLTAPIAIHQIYQFVKPALPVHARKYSWLIFFSAMLLMISGVLFGYFFAVPAALKFLTTFAGDVVIPNLTAESYLNFFMAYIGGLGILFQLPLLLIFWNWLSPLSPKKLLSSERYVIAGAFVVAAMITPTPDAFNQCMVAAPIIVIYQLGAIAVLVINKHRAPTRHARKATVAAEPLRAPARVTQPKVAVASTGTAVQPTMRRQMDVMAPKPAQSHKPAPMTVTKAAATPQVSHHQRPQAMEFRSVPRHMQSVRRTPGSPAPTLQRAVRANVPERPQGMRAVHRSLDGVSTVRTS